MNPVAIDYNAIRTALIHAVIVATGLDQNHVLTAEAEIPDAPRPTRPYMTLKITTAAARYGDDSNLAVDGDGAYLLRGPRLMVVSFNAYGTTHEQAYGLVQLWQASLAVPAVRDVLDGAGIAVWQPGAVTDLSMLLETGYEGRAQMDCRFGIRSVLRYRVDTIEVATVGGSIETDGVHGTVGVGRTTVSLGGGS